MTIQEERKPIPTTVRLDAVHEKMLRNLQSRKPGVSSQKIFEGLLEEADARHDRDVTIIATSIREKNTALFDALADL